MTFSQATSSAFRLALGGHINGEKFTAARFAEQVARLMRGSDRYIFQIALPDGEWFCEITRGSYGYDLYVPETREQEAHLIDLLLGK